MQYSIKNKNCPFMVTLNLDDGFKNKTTGLTGQYEVFTDEV